MGTEVDEDNETRWVREEREYELAEEQHDLESAWEAQVTNVLSSCEIAPECKGKRLQWLKRYEGKVSSEQITALKQSKYGRCFQQFINLWKQLPEQGRMDLGSASGMFARLTTVTHGTYNELCHERKNSSAQHEFTELEVLRKAQWLQPYLWSDGWQQLYPYELAEQLQRYIELGMEWPYLERLALKAAVRSAYHEQRDKVKLPFENLFVYLGLRFVGWLLPILVMIGVDVAIVVWALGHLSGESASMWAIVGLVFVGLTAPITLIHFGMSEVRYLLKHIAYPGYDPFEPKINVDLNALHIATNMLRPEHINLRLAREQIARLQSTEIRIPVQFLTLIDRAIAKGVHSW